MEEEEEELWHMFTEAIRGVAPHLLAGKRGKHAQTQEPNTKSDLVADVALHLNGSAIGANRLSAFYHRKGHLSPVERQAVKAWAKGTADTLVGKAAPSCPLPPTILSVSYHSLCTAAILSLCAATRYQLLVAYCIHAGSVLSGVALLLA